MQINAQNKRNNKHNVDNRTEATKQNERQKIHRLNENVCKER